MNMDVFPLVYVLFNFPQRFVVFIAQVFYMNSYVHAQVFLFFLILL